MSGVRLQVSLPYSRRRSAFPFTRSPPTSHLSPLTSHALNLAPLLLVLLPSPGASQIGPADTLPRKLHLSEGGLSPSVGNLCRIQPARGFTYAGGQRFVLQQTADAEQHFFVVTDSAKRIRQLYWFQAEELLPGLSGGYDYSADSTRTVGTLPWAVNLRANSGPPRVGSDGAAMLDYLTGNGYQFLPMAPRLRLVYVPESRGRREFMIIYLEAVTVASADTTFDEVVARARGGLKVEACR